MLQTQMIRYIQHLEAVEVRYTHSDLPRALAQVIVALPKDENGAYLSGEALADAILAACQYSREWFEAQEAKLAGTVLAVQSLPAELQALAPAGTQPTAEWYEDVVAAEPALVDGVWQQTWTVADLRVPDQISTLKARLKERITAERYARETAGITWNGQLIRTDRESQATVTGAMTKALMDEATVVNWKTATGEWVALDKAAISALSTAVFDHVQSAFNHESTLLAAVDSAETVEAVLAIDIAQGW